MDYPRRWAVVAGVGDYRSGVDNATPDLLNAVNDACRVHRVLTEFYGFSSSLLCDAGLASSRYRREVFAVQGPATRSAILDAMQSLAAQADPHDLFVFFFAGHCAGPKGPLQPSGSSLRAPGSCLEFGALLAQIRQIPCQASISIIDACFAGAAADWVEESGLAERDAAFLFAATQRQRAEDRPLDVSGAAVSNQHSPFTQAFVELIEQRSGWDLDELHRDIRSRVMAASESRQTPGLKMGGRRLRWPYRAIRLTTKQKIWHSGLPELSVGAPAAVLGRLSVPGAQGLRWEIEPEAPGVRISAAGELHAERAKLPQDRCDLLVRAFLPGGLELARSRLVLLREADEPLRVATASLRPCMVAELYATRLEAVGGASPYQWTASGLPAGLSLDPDKEQIRGLVARDAGRERIHHPVKLTVSDACGRTNARWVGLAVIDLEEYCEIPAGSSVIESQLSSAFAADAPPPAGRVKLPAFFIKKYPVTRAEWARARKGTGVVDANGRVPATGHSFEQVVEYCARRGVRLPSCAEWERAARGDDSLEYPWGADFDHDLLHCAHLQWGELTRVDQFPQGASPFGVMDLAGNAREYVADGAGNGLRPLKGGCFLDLEERFFACRAIRWSAASQDAQTGFRDVIEAHDAPTFPQEFLRIEGSQIAIARYAVSNEEYLDFHLAPDNAVDQQTPTPPEGWDLQKLGDGALPFRFEDRHLPVTGIGLNEARAFCQWKGRRLARIVRLPRWSEWLQAVRGGSQRRYPWGNEFCEHKCNLREAGWRRPLPVFSLADSAAECGALHLLGNVYEWCDGKDRGLAGGSWSTTVAKAEQIADPREAPGEQVGFRYVAQSLRPGGRR